MIDKFPPHKGESSEKFTIASNQMLPISVDDFEQAKASSLGAVKRSQVAFRNHVWGNFSIEIP